MVQLSVVYGEWLMKEMTCQFLVDKRRGGRMFFLSVGFSHEELIRMARDEYNLDKRSDVVELTYSLPDSMLQYMAPDTPPMHVTNDRQVQNLIELCRMHVICLCVSSRLDTSNGNCDNQKNDNPYEDSYEDVNEHEDEDEDEDEEEDAEGGEDKNSNGLVGIDNEDDGDDDYSVYGKVKDDDEDDISFDCKGRFVDQGGGSSIQSWSNNIFVIQSFADKEELLRELRLTEVMLRFTFKVYKSTKTVFVAICRVRGCKWRLRASVKNEPNWFWVTNYLKVPINGSVTCPQSVLVMPPDVKPLPGRKKKSRWQTWLELAWKKGTKP